MSAGRGTPRFPPVEGLPVFEGFSAEFTGAAVYPVPPGPWGISYKSGGSQLLTSNYVRYVNDEAAFNFPVPYGAVKTAINLSYTPAEVGGQLALQVKWLTDPGLAYLLDGNAGTPTVAPSEDPNVEEIPLYGSSIVTPAAPDTNPIRYVIPFSVPSITPFISGSANPLDLATKYLLFQIFAREVGGGAAGTLTVSEVVAESFGNSQVVSTR
jgi:hypothetical protein